MNEIWMLDCDHYYVYLQIIKRTSIESDSEDEAGRFYLSENHVCHKELGCQYN